jgi:putative transposase
MEVTRAYRHKLNFTGKQDTQARQFAGCRRLIYNSGLEQRSLGYRVTGKPMNYKRQTYGLKDVKADPNFAFLRDVPAQILQQGLLDLDRAFANFFAKRAKYPKFRKRGENDSFRFPQPSQIDVHDPARIGQVRLPKLGWCSLRNSYPRLADPTINPGGPKLFEGELKSVTVKREPDGWYASFCCVVQMKNPLMPTGPPIGLDVGIANSVATSEGDMYHLPVITKAEWAKIGRLQTGVNLCVKGSRNREKAVRRLARYRRGLVRRKHDALHKLTTTLAKSFPFIAAEDLRILNMSASAKGTVEEPGTNVAQKAGLNKAILDQCWGEFFRQLGYKCPWYGSVFLQVRPHYSSQECSECKHIAKENRDSQAVFRCELVASSATRIRMLRV